MGVDSSSNHMSQDWFARFVVFVVGFSPLGDGSIYIEEHLLTLDIPNQTFHQLKYIALVITPLAPRISNKRTKSCLCT